MEVSKYQVVSSYLEADVSVQNSAAGNQAFFREVHVDAKDSVVCEISKVREDLFNVRLFNWKGDNVQFNVDVTESGCPTITYGFSLDVKPANGKQKQKAVTVSRPVARPRVKNTPVKPPVEEPIFKL